MSWLLSLLEDWVLGWTWMAWSCWGTPAPEHNHREGNKEQMSLQTAWGGAAAAVAVCEGQQWRRQYEQWKKLSCISISSSSIQCDYDQSKQTQVWQQAEQVTCERDSSRKAEDSLLSLLRLLGGSQRLTMLPLEGEGVLLQLAQRNGRGARRKRSACWRWRHRKYIWNTYEFSAQTVHTPARTWRLF